MVAFEAGPTTGYIPPTARPDEVLAIDSLPRQVIMCWSGSSEFGRVAAAATGIQHDGSIQLTVITNTGRKYYVRDSYIHHGGFHGGRTAGGKGK